MIFKQTLLLAKKQKELKGNIMKYQIYDSDDHFICAENDIYRKFKFQFEHFLNGESVAQSDEQFYKMYVSEYTSEKVIKNFITTLDDCAGFYIGFTGIGKTTTLRYCLDLGIKDVSSFTLNTTVNFDNRELKTGKQTIVFPTFANGIYLNRNTQYSIDLPERVQGLCAALEKENPDLSDLFMSSNGRYAFLDFIQDTVPRIIPAQESVWTNGITKDELTFKRLEYARVKHEFEYYASKLKWYISLKYDKYDRLVILLDDVETIPEKYQIPFIEQYLHLYRCMRNTKRPDNGQYAVKLLISIRPHTLRVLQNNSQADRRIGAFPIKKLFKNHAVDLDRFFENRFDYYTSLSPQAIGNLETWKACKDVLMNLNHEYADQYKDMISNLCFMDIRRTLTTYARILSNRMWVQDGKAKESNFTINELDYKFNNITVIRAIGCGEAPAFSGNETQEIPNIFFTSEDEDYSIYCLLVMRYFSIISKRHPDDLYGAYAEEFQSTKDQWIQALGNDLSNKLIFASRYLFGIKVLRKSIRDFDDYDTMDLPESLDGKSKLYISMRGNELLNMLSRDSVYFEMLRERAWREYDGKEEVYSRLSSADLMRQGNQHLIFLDLLEYVDSLRESEEEVFFNNVDIDPYLYQRIFGKSLVSETILKGIENSLNFSGIIEHPTIKKKLFDVRLHFNTSTKLLRDQ